MTHPRSSRALALIATSAVALTTLSACNRSQNGQPAGGASGAAYADSGYVVGSGANASPPPAQAPRREYARYAPPPIPTYDQPPPPGEGYMWTPGYWGWTDADEDYYWVPGVWVMPPDPGLYWTPGYWAFVDDEYVWSPGFWGATIGFYGGIDYGWGYDGSGYYGGRWQDGRFYYNAALNNLGPGQAQYVYRDQHAIWGRNQASYNGGPGGIRAVPGPTDQAALAGRRLSPTRVQASQAQLARQTQGLRASVNRGAPPIAAVSRAGDFRGPGVVTHLRSAGRYSPPARAAQSGGGAAGHAVAPGGVSGHGGGFAGGPGGSRNGSSPGAERASGFHGPATERAAAMNGGFHGTEGHAAAARNEAPRGGPAVRTETAHGGAERGGGFSRGPERAAPSYHAAPQREAPAFHAAPQRSEPAFHAAPQRSAPEAHAAPQRSAPAAHAAPAQLGGGGGGGGGNRGDEHRPH
ncbi:MAG TPA: YXWGXW repeat-containing protein [Caulobacteraceae bacterium]|nr:YXWGXW repeat-containing protein [Caulobacteraceae bacterium]